MMKRKWHKKKSQSKKTLQLKPKWLLMRKATLISNKRIFQKIKMEKCTLSAQKKFRIKMGI